MADMKQKNWWKKQLTNVSSHLSSKYKYDYIVVLIAHGFSWSFIMMIPVLFGNFYCIPYACILLLNTFVHAMIDNDKANRYSINLIQDQLLHLLQVFATWLVFFTT